MTWVYHRFNQRVYTTGYYDPDGEFQRDRDYDRREDAAMRVSYLNGGVFDPEVAMHLRLIADVIANGVVKVSNG